jgi:hypothetical protein
MKIAITCALLTMATPTLALEMRSTSATEGAYRSVQLRCTKAGGLSAVLLNADARTIQRVSTAQAKVGDGASTTLRAEQDRFLPALVTLKGLDPLARDLLRTASLTVKVGRPGTEDNIQTFTFDGLPAQADAFLKECPPF